MLVVSVVVRGRVPGRDAGAYDVRLDVAAGSTARELIGAAVAAQLAGDGPVGTAAESRWAGCARLYLTDDEITAMAAEGAVRLVPGQVLPTVAAATAQAVAAFRRGVFVMFAGARQVHELDEVVDVADGDRLVFLRLTALVGG